jgi:hypothetical protein
VSCPREDDFDTDREFDWGCDDPNEPVGSCDWCGVNLYADDDDELCDQCLWSSEQSRGDDDSGIQPVV